MITITCLIGVRVSELRPSPWPAFAREAPATNWKSAMDVSPMRRQSKLFEATCFRYIFPPFFKIGIALASSNPYDIQKRKSVPAAGITGQIAARRLGGARHRSLLGVRWFHADQPHHSSVFVLE